MMKTMLRRFEYTSPEVSEMFFSAETVLCASDNVSYGDDGNPGLDPDFDDDFTI